MRAGSFTIFAGGCASSAAQAMSGNFAREKFSRFQRSRTVSPSFLNNACIGTLYPRPLRRRQSRSRASGEEAGCPRPLKVESADPAVAVQRLARQVQAGNFPRLHRAEIDLVQRNAPGRHLGVIPTP